MKKFLSILFLLLTVNLIVAENPFPEVSSYAEQPSTKSIIYPNPARDFAKVKNKSSSKIKNITILSMVGSSMLSQNVTDNNEQELNLIRLKPGRYFVKVTYNDGYQEILNLIKL